jgi:hypothetical protein
MPHNRSDAALRDMMASELRHKASKEKLGEPDVRGAYRKELQDEMDDPSRFSKRKLEALKDGAVSTLSAAITPAVLPLGTEHASRQYKETTGKPNWSSSINEGFNMMVDHAKDSGRGIKDAIRKYKSANQDKEAVEREAEAEVKRETRGMKKGGKVKVSSASKRADGIAQRGKTRGRMV